MPHNDPDHHDVFPGGKAGVDVTGVTQSEIDALLEAAGLPTSTTPVDDRPTQPAPPLGKGFEPYETVIPPSAYLRAPLNVCASLLDHPLY